VTLLIQHGDGPVDSVLHPTDLSQASVITMFLLPNINLQLRPAILGLRPGTRVVSNSFDMGEWEPDQKADVQAANSRCESYCTAILWIVPAKVAGSYSLPKGRLELEQEFQMLSGTLRSGGAAHAVKGRVRGEEVMFSAGGKNYRGRMRGKTLALE